MLQIVEYPLMTFDEVDIEMPHSARILGADDGDGQPYLEALVNVEHEVVSRKFRLVASMDSPMGYEFYALKHRGGFSIAGTKFNVFEVS